MRNNNENKIKQVIKCGMIKVPNNIYNMKKLSKCSLLTHSPAQHLIKFNCGKEIKIF